MTTLPAGTRITRGLGGLRYAFSFPGGATGAGRGAGGTTLRLADRTISAASRRLVPNVDGKTNPLYVVRVTGKSPVLAGLTIDGGVQGTLYNGFRVEKSKGAVVHDLVVTRVPGDDDVPPGETFGGNFWVVAGPVIHDVEFDGAGVGASGLGYNSCSGGSTTLVTAHHHPHCKGIAFWQHTGGHVIDRFESLHNAFALGFERFSGTAVIKNSKFLGSTRADLHVGNDKGRGQFHVIDPILPGRRLKVLLPPKEMGRPNKQRREDVRLTIDGRDRSDLIDFVTRA